MNKQNILAVLLFLIFTGLLFQASIFKGYIPFPGDVLLSSFKPWQVSSYDGYNPGSIPHKAQYPDVIRQMYPWRIEAMRQWQEGKIPLWNPYSFSGTPLLANFQSAALYPLNIFFLFFSKEVAWTVLVGLQPFLAFLLTYLFLRSIRISFLSALFGAVSYGLSGFMTVWLEYNTVGHIMSWFPLGLLSLELLSQKKYHPVILHILLLMSVIMSLLSGHPQVSLYAIVFLLAYALFRLTGKERVFSCLTFFLGFGIAASALIPGIELAQVSARASHTYEHMTRLNLIQPWQTLMLFFPNLFGSPVSRTYWLPDTYVGKVTSIGLIPLFFLLSSFRLFRDKIVRYFLIAAGIIGGLITFNPVSAVLYYFPLPVISSSNPTLMVFLFSFCLSVLTSFGIDGFMKEKHSLLKLGKRALQVGIGFFILAAIFLLAPGLKTHASVALRALLYAGVFASLTLAGFYIAIQKKGLMPFVLWILLIIHAIDLSYAFFKFNPFVPSSYIYPQHQVTEYMREVKEPHRFWGYGTAAIDANISTYIRAYSPDGYDPLYPRWYGEFIGASKDGKLIRSFTNDTRSDARIISGFGETDFRNNEFRKRVLRSLGVSLILDRAENGTSERTFPPGEFVQSNVSDWRIFTDTKSPGIVRIASQSKIGVTKEEFEKIFFHPDFDVAKDVVLHDSSLPPLSGIGKISLVEYGSDRISAVTDTEGTTMMLSASTYYPGWRAYVDGKKESLHRVNWTMNGVIVSPGRHTVTLQYEPSSFRLGLWVSALSLLLFLLLMIVRKKIS